MGPPVLRRRNASSHSLNKGDEMLEERLEKEKELGFSDDESFLDNGKDDSATTTAMPLDLDREIDSLGDDPLNDVIAQTHFTAEAEEVEDDVEMFNKAIHITNIDQVDHAGLLTRMHARFKKKVTKWETLAFMYSRYSFVMNFAILTIQVMQMIMQQAANIWLTEKFAVTIQTFLTAITALLAGLQLKLKLNEKSERYRRGAKVYGRLLRISTYYIMMLESGGKIQDVTGLWREAMKKEGKWIPLVRTYMPV